MSFAFLLGDGQDALGALDIKKLQPQSCELYADDSNNLNGLPKKNLFLHSLCTSLYMDKFSGLSIDVSLKLNLPMLNRP